MKRVEQRPALIKKDGLWVHTGKLPVGFDYVLIPQGKTGGINTADILASLADAGRRIQAKLNAVK